VAVRDLIVRRRLRKGFWEGWPRDFGVSAFFSVCNPWKCLSTEAKWKPQSTHKFAFNDHAVTLRFGDGLARVVVRHLLLRCSKPLATVKVILQPDVSVGPIRTVKVCELQTHAPRHLGRAREWTALCQVNPLIQ